ncbi:hypothetical protein O181_061768 [Austropuccinia psidii MF-1]|uniref:DUF7872 domain-containing protein n=1 Tax=Austropuccinia psidii MF-1 TaxID=1389203 RepID=A0A9Q3HYW1_9BASI|nr:hypothetical protein [Austropuccinia psidii MF-1]
MKIIVQLSVGWPAFLVSLALSSIYAKERSLALNSQKSSQNKTEHSFPKGIDQDPCLKVPLRPQLWSSLKMNTYLDEYPWGSELNLEVSSPHPCMVCTSTHDPRANFFYIFETLSLNLFLRGVCFPSRITLGITWGPITSGMFSSLGDIAWNSLVGVMYVSTSLAYINAVLLVGGGEDRFTRVQSNWRIRGSHYYHKLYTHLVRRDFMFFTQASGVAKMLAEAQKGIQSTICNITRSIVNSPINQRTGLAGINPDGIFLNEVPSNFQNNLQREFELAMKLKTLAKFWRVQLISHGPCHILNFQNAFIVRGSDPCVQSGPNGAFSREDMLSYCGDDNIMMNIVRAEKHGNGFDPTIYNAQLLETKYGYSAEFLTTSAWKCQSKYGVFEYDACILSNRTSTQFTLSELSKAGDCYFSIPVCDLTKPGRSFFSISNKVQVPHSIGKCRNYIPIEEI